MRTTYDIWGHFIARQHLFELAEDGEPMRRYDIGWGPLSFVPLRLRKLETKSGGDVAIDKLWVLGRLELATSTGPWKQDAKSASPFGPEEPYKAGDLYMLELNNGSLELKPAQVEIDPRNGGDDVKRRLKVTVSDAASGAGDMAYIRIKAKQHITGGCSPKNVKEIPLLVGLQPREGGSARLNARLFGDNRSLVGKVTKFASDELVLEFVPHEDLKGMARASTITVRFKSESDPKLEQDWVATIELGVELQVMSGNARLFSRKADGAWQWMNVSAPASAANNLDISHESGAISLEISGAFDDAEPLLGWPVAALTVKGYFALVFPAGEGWPEAAAGGASFIEVEARGRDGFLLRHLQKGSEQEVKLDWQATCESVIRWPRQLKVGSCSESSDWDKDSDYVRLVTIPKATIESLPVHMIDLVLREQPIPLEVLGTTPKDVTPSGFGIMAPWTFLAAASHELKDGAQGNSLSWQTLDRIEILPAAKMVEADDAFGFAPRFKHGKYRTRDPDKNQIPHHGVARTAEAQTGFQDPNIPKADSWQPVIRASSVTAFIDNVHDIGNPSGIVTQVPWLADLSKEDGAFKQATVVLAQCHTDRELNWRIASVDAEHSAKKLLLSRQQSEIALPVDADASEIDKALEAALAAKADSIASQQRPVTQAWFELFKEPNPIDEIRAAEMLFFPETMLVFDQLWESSSTSIEARAIYANGDENGVAVHVRLRNRAVAAETESAKGDAVVFPPRLPVEIIALDRREVFIVPEPLTVIGASANNLLGPVNDTGRGRARLRELVKRRMLSPRLIFVRAELDAAHKAWQLVQLPRPTDDFGASVNWKEPQPVPASAALGWPSCEGTDIAGKLGPVGGVDVPVLSSRAGLAGRGSTFRLPAWAPGMDGPEALYVTFATHVAFARPPQVTYTGPAARHLSVSPARLRAPLCNATKEALRKLIGAKNAQQVSVAAISPPALERTSIGDRPGELHAWTTSVVVPAEDVGFDPLDVRYGRPATSSPILARQHRAPRAPLLPADKCLSLRRRTYVSEQDKSDDDLAEAMLFAGAATLLRLNSGADEIRCTLEIASDFRLGDGWDGKLKLHLDTAPATSVLDWDCLVKAGLLPTELSKTTAQVRVGNEKIALSEWSFQALPKGIDLFFRADPGNKHRILTALRATNIDVPIVFDMQLEAQNPTTVKQNTFVKLGVGLPAAIRQWPVRNISIPLQRAAGARATLAVDLHTVAFGDAAYDRQLAAPTFESPPTTLANGKRLVLVTDREEYNLDDMILFTAGVRAEQNGIGWFAPYSFEVAWGLSVHVQPRRKEADLKPPPLRELRFPIVDKTTDVFELKPPMEPPSSAHALHPRSLVELNGKPAELEAGDRLVLTVRPKLDKNGENPDREKYCSLMVRLTDLPSFAPPPAVYSLVTAPQDFRRATIAMHACAPMPDIVEYPSLEADLFRGMVPRRALFIWQWATVDEKADLATLVKVDRSGGAQLPANTDGFIKLPSVSTSE